MRRGRASRRLAALCLLCAASGCASARTHRLPLAEERLARAHTLDVETRAPEPWARFLEAKRLAEQGRLESDERRDHESEARLWLEAAITEAERVQLSGQRLELEREIEGLDEAFVRTERTRASVARENQVLAAASVARQEAERALARAALAPQQRIKLSNAELSQAAEALIGRVQLVQGALLALGAKPEALARVEAGIAEARGLVAKNPSEALRAADDTLFYALSVAGTLRKGEAAPPDAERASLVEALSSAGARPQRNDRGLAGTVDNAFHGVSLGAPSVRVLARLCTLADAYPRGPVRVTVAGASAREVEQRTRAIRELYARSGCQSERFGFDSAIASGRQDIEVTWLSY